MDTQSLTSLSMDEPGQITPHSQNTDMRVNLLVGERRFTTTRQTLVTESPFFTSLLSGRWGSTLDDGSYFIDADPALFEHILRYLRHSIYPIFYDEKSGHNYGLYLALLGEAQYFGISRLEEWLERKRYVDAVQLKCDFETHEDAESISGHYKTSPTDTIMEFHPSWGTRKIYICPRNIAVHRGNPWKCGRQCQNVQGDNPDTYDDEPTLRLFVVKKQVIVQHSVCIAQSDED